MSKRAIFEETAGQPDGESAPAGGRTPPRQAPEARGAIALWLWALAALVAVMVLVGGLTRLTDSGLSITEWDPVMGAVPPLSAADWEAAFGAYRETAEFQQQNHWMTLEQFRPIYWWEWGHRQLGRVIGLVWAAGFLWFLARRAIPKGWTGRLLLPGALGGLQGAVGWWMVASGLDRLDVASYRLATHLGLAFVIFMLLIWYAQRVRLAPVALLQARRARPAGLGGWTGLLAAALLLQILVGALVAGIDAGRGFVDWPLMQGRFFPEGALALEPWWRNLFESPGLVQFVHRMLGYAVLALTLAVAWRLGRAGLVALKARAQWLAAAMAAQVVIGIVTVMHASPLEIAIFHQAGALVAVFLLMRARFAALYPAAQRLTA
ncbi:COX15/CtaA family protein [Paralimibaculum aggregatum]|uniref:Heme A synthase n=1 Tax=Paralimibaculum aggregatum TaxID=3036245 RepID=A0ABQ6LP22_9RHOB|nr:COX15/CtaA family protein [Limibaculum sp. NKW23]GMG84732.1 COX15/CtaA family protein [Limibaculum sp. NKW23]